MPQKMWKHNCPIYGGLTWAGVETCESCGQIGEYDGWHYSIYEAMARYQNLYGLKPIGLHRKLADELFFETTIKCLKCDGKGLIDINQGRGYRACPECNGIGRFFNRSAKEIEKIRQQVIVAFPDAVVETKIPGVAADSEDQISGKTFEQICASVTDEQVAKSALLIAENLLGQHIKNLLECEGFNVTLLEYHVRPDEIYSELHRARYDLIILTNTCLSPNDILALVPRIKENFPKIKILIASGWDSSDFIDELKRSGINHFFSLPFGREAIPIIKELLSNKVISIRKRKK